MAPRKRHSSQRAQGTKKLKSDNVPPELGATFTEDRSSLISSTDAVQAGLKALELVILAAVYSPISQLTLSPTFGSIPASIFHQRLTVMGTFLGLAIARYTGERMLHLVSPILPVLAFSIPTLQFFLTKYCAQLGPTYGPLVSEIMTYFPLIILSTLCASATLISLLDAKLSDGSKTILGAGFTVFSVFTGAQRAAKYVVAKNAGSSLIFSRCGLQYILATFYALILPSQLLLLALAPLLHSAAFNFHVPLTQNTAALQTHLAACNWSLVARQESLTGYISILENLNDGYRVMRCDHSLLGGEWLQKHQGRSLGFKEPIYPVFVTLEAVRLVLPDQSISQDSTPDIEQRALVIGLGVGTTPAALVAHGINTTVVEIDPVVHDFATRFFDLPTNITSAIEDAVDYVQREDQKQVLKYDYVIHDVFTGGAEPVALFTEEFLSGLHRMLKPEGIIAINYAGDLLLQSASMVFNTIRTVFSSCRLFRDDPRNEASSTDFTNMIIFCLKSTRPITFRQPMEADFLGSVARQHRLLPQNEIPLDYFDKLGTKVLKRSNMHELEAFQVESAVGHWNVMRTILPDFVWENW